MALLNDLGGRNNSNRRYRRGVVVFVLFLLVLAYVLSRMGPISPEQLAAVENYHSDPSRDCPQGSGYQRCLSLDLIERIMEAEPPPPPAVSKELLRQVAQLEGLQYLDLDYNRLDSLEALRSARDLVSLKFDVDLLRWPVSLAALQHVRHLSLGSLDGVDISALADLPELQSLSFSAGPNDDLKPLAALNADIDLTYSADSSGKIEQLGHISGLRDLRLFRVRDLAPLAHAKRLAGLTMEPEGLLDLNPLAELPNLTRLYIGGSVLSDIGPLAKNTSLIHLRLFNTAVSDLKPLATMTKLETLMLDFSDIDDISVLSELPELRELHLAGHTPLDLSPLLNLSKVEKIYLNNRKCLVDPGQMLALQAKGVVIRPTFELNDDPAITVASKMCSSYRDYLARSRAEGREDCIGYEGGDCKARRR